MFHQKAHIAQENVIALTELTIQMLKKLESMGEMWINALWVVAEIMTEDN